MLTGSKRKAMKMPGPRKTKPRKTKCRHRIVVRTWGELAGQVLSKRCSLSSGCGAPLSLGPSNDDIPLDEIAHATFAKDDGYWMLFEDPDGYDWDVIVRGAEILTDAKAAAIIEQSSHSYAPYASDAFAPVDTASREPWHTTQETQSTGNSETIDALIERSSVGQGLRNIRENGIDAELKQLEEEMKLLPDAHGGADL